MTSQRERRLNNLLQAREFPSRILLNAAPTALTRRQNRELQTAMVRSLERTGKSVFGIVREQRGNRQVDFTNDGESHFG